MNKVVNERNEELIVLNLSELRKLNHISVCFGYNRNLNDECYELIKKFKKPTLVLQNLLIHNHKGGESCDPHVRYIVHQVNCKKIVNTFTIDLPMIPIIHLLCF